LLDGGLTFMAIPQIAPEELAQCLTGDKDKRPVLLDVRSPSEYARAHLPGATLIPLAELQERMDELEPLQGKEVVVYCHHGIRSQSGAALLLAKGIAAKSLAGGIDRWSLVVDATVPRY
jgi:rhodanese-related sulfurtransferase